MPRLTRDLPDDDLKAGDVGTVVERHIARGMEDGYSIEFFDMTGQTVAVVTVPASLLRSPTQADRPAGRWLPEHKNPDCPRAAIISGASVSISPRPDGVPGSMNLCLSALFRAL
jgi:hypothetical protein